VGWGGVRGEEVSRPTVQTDGGMPPSMYCVCSPTRARVSVMCPVHRCAVALSDLPPPCPPTHACQQRRLEAEQWLRRVDAAKAQAHPDNVAHIAQELESLQREVDALLDAGPSLPVRTTQAQLQLKDIKMSLGIQRVLVQRSQVRMDSPLPVMGGVGGAGGVPRPYVAVPGAGGVRPPPLPRPLGALPRPVMPAPRPPGVPGAAPGGVSTYPRPAGVGAAAAGGAAPGAVPRPVVHVGVVGGVAVAGVPRPGLPVGAPGAAAPRVLGPPGVPGPRPGLVGPPRPPAPALLAAAAAAVGVRPPLPAPALVSASVGAPALAVQAAAPAGATTPTAAGSAAAPHASSNPAPSVEATQATRV
jgi:hypothetical protein